MAKIQVSAYKCERCEHVWMPRGVEEPKVCPKCKSPYWDRPRMNARQIAVVNLYKMFGTHRLRFRESAEGIIESLPKGNVPVTIDFANIDFASRSFLQELLSGLASRKLTFKNTPEFVQGLIEIIQRKAAPATI